MALYHLIYVSRAARNIQNQDVAEILRLSRIRNGKLNISGLLLYADDSFIQVLEGDKNAVEDVFASIERDARHKEVTVLVRENIQNRDFPDWSMGFERVSGGLPKGVADAFLIDRDSLRQRLSQTALDVKSFIHGFLKIAAR